MAARLKERSFLVIFEPKEEYCMCKVFDEIGKQLHALAAKRDRYYFYEMMKLVGKGYMVVCFKTNEGSHEQELRDALSGIVETFAGEVQNNAEEIQNAEANKDSKKYIVLLDIIELKSFDDGE